MKNKLKTLDLSVNPIIQTLVSFIASISFLFIWSQISSNFLPNIFIFVHTSLFCLVAILISAKLVSIIYNRALKRLYIIACLVNAVNFLLMLTILVFARVEYIRIVILVFFLSSTFVFFLSFVYHENRRRYTLFVVPIGRRIKIINSNNMRIIGTRLIGSSRPKNKLIDKVDGIIVDFSSNIPENWQRYISMAAINGIKIYDSKKIIEDIDGYIPVDSFAQISAEWGHYFELYGLLKRFLDIIISILVLPFFLPIIFISIYLIKYTSDGPGFFKQMRVGKGGKIFCVYKLRTMYFNNVNSPTVNTVDGDPRITNIGKILRKTRVDEFPQIFNILKGEMSWIGPRPETVDLSRKYEEEIPFYSYRYSVRPGITGWAAVNQGYVGDTALTAIKLNYDLYYIKNYGPIIDFITTLKTIRVIFSGYGAK